MQFQIKELKLEADKLTDNIFTMKKFITDKNPGMNMNEMDKHFGISPEFDYIS